MLRILRAAMLGFCCLGLPAAVHAAVPSAACTAGAWLEPATGARIEHAAVVAAAAKRAVVLLGEMHDNPEHHRWQLSTLAALLGQGRPLVLGFEAFPRRVQPVLDRWVAGELDEQAFLDAVDWQEIWGFDPDLYLPLLHFARLHRVPVVALNVERGFVARVGREGWDAVPAAERQGLGDPAAPPDAYLDRLARSFAQHRQDGNAPSDPAALRARPEFRHFADAQLTWDRAMAEALAAAHGRAGAPLAVGIIGSEHLRHRHGVPHQLADLGVADAAVLLPQDLGGDCALPPPDLADAVFLLDLPPAARPRPRLGVLLSTLAEGVRVAEVMPGSVAQAAGMQVDDIVLRAAGLPVASGADLIAVVRRQAPGTWLPLELRRDGRTLEAVAKFPPEALP